MCELQERSLCGPKIGSIEHRKKPCNKNDAPAEKHGIVRNMSISLMTATRPRSTRVLKFLVITSTIFEETRGKNICGRCGSINAHAEQERSEFSRTGDCSGIQKPHNGYHNQWRSANTWGSHSIRSRLWALRGGAHLRRHASCPNVGQKPQLTKNGKIILCKTENFVLIVVPGSTGSSSSRTSSSSSSLPQDTSGGISPSPAIQRSDDTHAQASRNRGGPTKTKKQNQKHWQQSSIEYLIVRSPRLVKRSSQKISRTKKCQHSLLKIQVRNVQPKWYRGSTVFIFTSQKTEIAKYAREPRLRGLLARSALAIPYVEQKSSVTW